jgi:hypothetical protein
MTMLPRILPLIPLYILSAGRRNYNESSYLSEESLYG